MTKPFARQTKLKNIVGRSQYITDDKRQEYIVLHSEENMEYYWQEYADYEKQNRKNKEENIQGREIIIALPNELDEDHDELKDFVDDYSKSLLGNNRDFEYAVHWNKEKTNLHAHIIYSERERQEPEPKRYKKDYYYNYEKGKMSNKEDPNAVITKHKGDIKYNKKGEEEYTDEFSKKYTKFKSREYNEKIKENLVETFYKYGFESRSFDNRIELPQAKLYKGASSDYIEKATESNKARAEYNDLITRVVDAEFTPMTTAIKYKQEIEKKVKEENSKTKSISVSGIEIIKESAQNLENYLRQTIQIIGDSVVRANALELEIKSLENQIEENKNEIKNNSQKIDDVRDERSNLPHYREDYEELTRHDKIINRYKDMNQDIINTKHSLKQVQQEYGKLKFYEIFKEKPLSIRHSKLKEELETLENKVNNIDIDKYKNVRKEINTKLMEVSKIRDKLDVKESEYLNKINRLGKVNESHEEEIQGLKASLKEESFKLNNPDIVENREQENREKKIPSSNKSVSAKEKSKENNNIDHQKERPKFSIDKLQKTHKEIDVNSDKEEKLKKVMSRSRGRGR